MALSLKKIGAAFAEWDFARRARSYGSTGGREVLMHAVRNLPKPELDSLRPYIESALATAMTRTIGQVESLGIEIDARDMDMRPTLDDPDKYDGRIHFPTQEP